MGFLQQLLPYQRVCIQCHNLPDADTIASAYGVYLFLRSKGIEAFIVYGGPQPIKKSNLRMLTETCAIPITYTHQPEAFDLLVMVDCQYGQSNTERFAAENIVIIDHHIRVVGDEHPALIISERQSCSTIIWELLQEEGFPLEEHPLLETALLYGLYTDTSSFADLFGQRDNEMRQALFRGQSIFDRLTKANMTVAELMVASDAMHNHYFDHDHRFAVVEALRCDQTVLGVIGDMMIQVDIIDLTFTYTRAGAGYQISLRSCRSDLPANEIAAFVCAGIGSGGGHAKKAGGYIEAARLRREYGDTPMFEVVNQQLTRYMEEKETASN